MTMTRGTALMSVKLQQWVLDMIKRLETPMPSAGSSGVHMGARESVVMKRSQRNGGRGGMGVSHVGVGMAHSAVGPSKRATPTTTTTTTATASRSSSRFRSGPDRVKSMSPQEIVEEVVWRVWKSAADGERVATRWAKVHGRDTDNDACDALPWQAHVVLMVAASRDPSQVQRAAYWAASLMRKRLRSEDAALETSTMPWPIVAAALRLVAWNCISHSGVFPSDASESDSLVRVSATMRDHAADAALDVVDMLMRTFAAMRTTATSKSCSVVDQVDVHLNALVKLKDQDRTGRPVINKTRRCKKPLVGKPAICTCVSDDYIDTAARFAMSVRMWGHLVTRHRWIPVLRGAVTLIARRVHSDTDASVRIVALVDGAMDAGIPLHPSFALLVVSVLINRNDHVNAHKCLSRIADAIVAQANTLPETIRATRMSKLRDIYTFLFNKSVDASAHDTVTTTHLDAIYTDMCRFGFTYGYAVGVMMQADLREDNPARAYHRLTDAQHRGVKLNVVEMSTAIQVLIAIGRIDAAIHMLRQIIKLYHDMRDGNHALSSPSPSSVSIDLKRLYMLIIKNYNQVIYQYCRFGLLSDAESVLKEMIATGFEPTDVTIIPILSYLADEGCYDNCRSTVIRWVSRRNMVNRSDPELLRDTVPGVVATDTTITTNTSNTPIDYSVIRVLYGGFLHIYSPISIFIRSQDAIHELNAKLKRRRHCAPHPFPIEIMMPVAQLPTGVDAVYLLPSMPVLPGVTWIPSGVLSLPSVRASISYTGNGSMTPTQHIQSLRKDDVIVRQQMTDGTLTVSHKFIRDILYATGVSASVVYSAVIHVHAKACIMSMMQPRKLQRGKHVETTANRLEYDDDDNTDDYGSETHMRLDDTGAGFNTKTTIKHARRRTKSRTFRFLKKVHGYVDHYRVAETIFSEFSHGSSDTTTPSSSSNVFGPTQAERNTDNDTTPSRQSISPDQLHPISLAILTRMYRMHNDMDKCDAIAEYVYRHGSPAYQSMYTQSCLRNGVERVMQQSDHCGDTRGGDHHTGMDTSTWHGGIDRDGAATHVCDTDPHDNHMQDDIAELISTLTTVSVNGDRDECRREGHVGQRDLRLQPAHVLATDLAQLDLESLAVPVSSMSSVSPSSQKPSHTP